MGKAGSGGGVGFGCVNRVLSRHCEERERRSNPALILSWIASLALAMTMRRMPANPKFTLAEHTEAR